MATAATVIIHPSQHPENIRSDLSRSLRNRQVNHKFHYDTVKQAQKWLALHEAFSPSRNDSECATIYEQSCRVAASRITAPRLHLIGLGCGGGWKEGQLLALLKERVSHLDYTPVDVSLPMVLTAREEALKVIPTNHCFPLICDLLTAVDLPQFFDNHISEASTRLFTFFGMLPNFPPSTILPLLGAFLRRGEHLLISANLAPGSDYSAGVEQILPQYDNPLTRDWLSAFLFDLGVEPGDGAISFTAEDCPEGTGLKRVVAAFVFSRARTILYSGERFEYVPNDSIRLFFSYRHTVDRLHPLLERCGLTIMNQWVTPEEGVFLCIRERR